MPLIICVLTCVSALILAICFGLGSKKDKKLIQYLDRIKEAQQAHTINLSNLKIYMDNINTRINLLNENHQILKDIQESHASAIASLTERHIHLQSVVASVKHIDRIRRQYDKSR